MPSPSAPASADPEKPEKTDWGCKESPRKEIEPGDETWFYFFKDVAALGDKSGYKWYNFVVKKIYTGEYFTPYQLKMPLEISQIIEISDPVYTLTEVMDHIDLR